MRLNCFVALVAATSQAINLTAPPSDDDLELHSQVLAEVCDAPPATLDAVEIDAKAESDAEGVTPVVTKTTSTTPAVTKTAGGTTTAVKTPVTTTAAKPAVTTDAAIKTADTKTAVTTTPVVTTGSTQPALTVAAAEPQLKTPVVVHDGTGHETHEHKHEHEHEAKKGMSMPTFDPIFVVGKFNTVWKTFTHIIKWVNMIKT